MKRLPILFILFAAACSSGQHRRSEAPDWRNVLSPVIRGSYRPASIVKQYTPQTLYDYIDGGADVYLDLGFLELTCVACDGIDNPDNCLMLEVYDMGTAKNAFGVYTTENECRSEIPIGWMATVSTNTLCFWKDRYYVKVMTSVPAVDVVTAVGSRVDYSLVTPEQGKIGYEAFPEQHLRQTSIRYSLKNVLGYDGLNNGFTASYRIGKDEMTAFIVECETPRAAGESLKKWTVNEGASPAADQPRGAFDEPPVVAVNARGETAILARKGRHLLGGRGPCPAPDIMRVLVQTAPRLGKR